MFDRSEGRAGLAAILLSCLVCAPGCSEAAPDAPASLADLAPAVRGERQHAQRQAEVIARVDALLATPTPATLLAVLATSHSEARTWLGRHRLEYTSHVKVSPETPARPVVDQPSQLNQDVQDTLVLVWAATADEPPQFHLSQTTAAGDRREVILYDDQVFTRTGYRGWFTRELDADLHQLWLDEAQRSVHDVIEFAAPALRVEATADADTITIQLQHSGATDRSQIAPGHGRTWRERTDITEVTGTLQLARATGLWQQADVSLEFVIQDVLDRRQLGQSSLQGRVTVDPQLRVTPPEAASPTPERRRLELERGQLLQGLAGT